MDFPPTRRRRHRTDGALRTRVLMVVDSNIGRRGGDLEAVHDIPR
jgi:hypothetical protein